MSRLASEPSRRLRRALWTTSLGLSLALVGLLFWFVSAVQPDVEAGLDTPVGKQADLRAWHRALRAQAERRVRPAPVAAPRLRQAILRPDLLLRDPPHFLFTGPLPGPMRSMGGPQVETSAPTGFLDRVRIAYVMLRGVREDGLVSLASRDGARAPRIHTTGSVIRVGSGDTEQAWKLEGLRAAPQGAFELRLRVLAGHEPNRIERVIWRRPDARIGARVVWTGAVEEADAGGPRSALTEAAARLAVPSATRRASRPRLVRDAGQPGRIRVELDGSTWQRLQQRTAADWARQVRTKESPHGLVILDRGSAPLDEFDIERGEVIVAINGRSTRTRSELTQALEALDPHAKEVHVTLSSRSGVRRTLVVDPRDPRTRRRARSALQQGTK